MKKDFYVLIIGFFLLVFSCFFGFVKVSGVSMMPSFQDKQILLRQRNLYSIDRFDVVVVKSDKLNINIIKRVIGLPGDTIRMHNGSLFINNKFISQDFNYNFEDFNVPEFTVPNNHYWCLGDNREHSTDSRVLGSFDKSDILGVILNKGASK